MPSSADGLGQPVSPQDQLDGSAVIGQRPALSIEKTSGRQLFEVRPPTRVYGRGVRLVLLVQLEDVSLVGAVEGSEIRHGEWLVRQQCSRIVRTADASY